MPFVYEGISSRHILDTICVLLCGAQTQKLVTYPHAYIPSLLVDTHFLTTRWREKNDVFCVVKRGKFGSGLRVAIILLVVAGTDFFYSRRTQTDARRVSFVRNSLSSVLDSVFAFVRTSESPLLFRKNWRNGRVLLVNSNRQTTHYIAFPEVKAVFRIVNLLWAMTSRSTLSCYTNQGTASPPHEVFIAHRER
jgi:hypothetical protein